jgi:membrane protein required for colicin V production
MNMTPNYTDGIIFLILFIFAFLAFLKGFVKEFFSTINLIIAITLSYIVSPYVSKFINISAPQILIDLSTQFIVFILTLIACSILSSKISNPLSDKIPDALNQTLGFGFGFTKGYFILSFVFAIALFFYSDQPSDQSKVKIENSKRKEKFGPHWLTESKSYGILEYGANFLQPLVSSTFSQIQGDATSKKNSDNDELDTVKEVIKSKKIYDKMIKEDNNSGETNEKDATTPKSEPESKEEDNSGYTDQEIKKMKRLIEIMSN